VAGHVLDPAECWVIRPTPTGQSAPTCGDARSRPPSPSQPANKPTVSGEAAKGGRPPQFDAKTYKQRNVVERAINKLKSYRAVASRYDKRDYMYRGTIDIASIRIRLRDPVS
jgi:transposase